ncbi:hypothetical protein Plec18167_009103 [Paecilomyces lecythidis]|uniref:Zn(2)-C6 fungal-type domain-containing protein n=1 Tax=Paecilomyces lecythidis TaxID=3004212 RepID=A0ABR3WRV0_9EURO
MDFVYGPSQQHCDLASQFPIPDLSVGANDCTDEAAFFAFESIERTLQAEPHPIVTDTLEPLYRQVQAPHRDLQHKHVEASAGAPAPTSGAKKKRSSIACRACHDKRVRCDAVVRGLPCSNCEDRAIECVFRNSKRSWGRRRFEGRNENRFRESIASYPQVMLQLNQPESDRPVNRPQNEPPSSELSSKEIAPMNDISHSPAEEGGRMVHMGESSLFSWLNDDQTNRTSLHRPIDEAQLSNSDSLSPEFPYDGDSLLSADLEQSLLDSFCQNFLLFYPIMHKNHLMNFWKSGTISPLLRQSVLFIGATHMDENTLLDAGFLHRRQAVETFYLNARRAYDNDIEGDRVCIVQSMFMLQFHFGPTPTHKDCFWWASAAVNLAQLVGMHRSTRGSILTPENQRLWKKIWWHLFIRDRQYALSMGKPLMIDERDCNVEPLTVDDFVDGESLETAHFTVSLMQIARLATDVIRYKFSPAPSNHCYEVYHQMILLLHRPTLSEAKRSQDCRDFSTQSAFYAADKICDLARDILQFFEVREFAIYAETIIMSAMVFHSVERPPTQREEVDRARKRNEIYVSVLSEFDKIFFAIPKYKFYFGERIKLWVKFSHDKENEHQSTFIQRCGDVDISEQILSDQS